MVRGGAPTSNPQVKGGGYWRLRGGVSAQCAGSPRSISNLVTIIIIIILQIVRDLSLGGDVKWRQPSENSSKFLKFTEDHHGPQAFPA